MKTVVFAGLCVLCSFAASAQANDEFHGIRRLEMRVASGDINVTGVESDLSSVEVIKKRYDERCELLVEQRGDLLLVVLASRNLFSARCEADFKIKVPKALAMKFKDGSGDISVEGTVGAVAVETGSGRIQVKAKLTAFSARTGSGDIHVQGLEAPATVRTGSGRVHVAFAKVPGEGRLEIHSGSGNAEVLFPKHSKIKTSFSAGSGRLENSLGEFPGAHFTVSMKTGSGNLVVGKF